jgi:hypothetical protein
VGPFADEEVETVCNPHNRSKDVKFMQGSTLYSAASILAKGFQCGSVKSFQCEFVKSFQFEFVKSFQCEFVKSVSLSRAFSVSLTSIWLS